MSPELVAIRRFKTLFNSIKAETLPDLANVYSHEVQFQDPFTELQGIAELTQYLAKAYRNVLYSRFDFQPAFGDRRRQALPWLMSLKHKRLAGGRPIQVHGMSDLRLAGSRVIYHRDYFDAGQLLYEHVPVLGPVVQLVRRYAT